MSGQVVCRGVRVDVKCIVLADGSCPAADFLTSLTKPDRIRVQVILAGLASSGKISNPEHCRELDESTGLIEIRSREIRFLGFRHGRDMCLVLGMRTSRRKHRQQDVRLVERYRDEFLSRN
jgi:hypothetical protein